MKFKFFSVFLLFFVVSEFSHAKQDNFGDILEKIESLVSEASFDDFKKSEDLTRFLSNVYQQAYDLDFRSIDIQDLRQNSRHYIERLFKVQTKVQLDLLGQWNDQGLLNNNKTLSSFYAILRVIRYTIDIIGEAQLDFPRLTGNEEVSTMFEEGPNSMVLGGNPYLLLPGTAFLVRGKAANSAAIARITDLNEGQFSHISMLTSTKTSRRAVVESLIETGLILTPYEKATNSGVVRAQAFVFYDEEIQRKAADEAMALIQPDVGHIPYNFSMTTVPFDVEVPRSFFCSDVIRYTYGVVTDREIEIPMYRSKIPQTDFTKSIGVKALETFAPSDIQSDSRFKPGPEWRDFRFTEKVRLQDFVLDHMLEALSQGTHEFNPSFAAKALSLIGRALSQTFIIRQIIPGVENIPRNMTRDTLMHVIMLHFSTQKLFEKIDAINNQYLLENGVPMTPKQINESLEVILNSGESFHSFVKK